MSTKLFSKQQKNRFTGIVGLFLFLAMTSSCSKESKYSSLKGKGKDAKRFVQTEVFTSVELYDNIELTIDNSLENNVILIEGGENLIENISVKNSDNILVFRDLNKFKWVYNYKTDVGVSISGKTLSKIYLHDAANIKTLGSIDSDELYIESSDAAGTASIHFSGKKLHIYAPLGMSDLIFSGQCENFYAYINDMHYLNAQNLQANYTQIHHLGTNLVKAPKTEQLGVTIENIGDVCYTGNPEILWNECKKSGKLVSGCP